MSVGCVNFSDFKGYDEVRSERDHEYAAFLRSTRELQAAKISNDRGLILNSVVYNNQLWVVLADDVRSPGNLLPGDVKVGILSLSSFVLRYGFRVLVGEASVDVLIDINKAMMRGWAGKLMCRSVQNCHSSSGRLCN